jgi:hypothetical protein
MAAMSRRENESAVIMCAAIRTVPLRYFEGLRPFGLVRGLCSCKSRLNNVPRTHRTTRLRNCC